MMSKTEKEWKIRSWLLATALLVFATIVWGGVTRVTGSGEACQGWPACLGGWLLPQGGAASIDYIHRLSAIFSLPLLLWTSYLAWRVHRDHSLIGAPVFLAGFSFIVQMGLGAILALTPGESSREWVSLLHLGLSLAILGFILISTTASFYHNPELLTTILQRPWPPLARSVIVTSSLVLFVLISGAAVKLLPQPAGCTGWILCDGSLLPRSYAAWVHTLHRVSVLLASLALFWLAFSFLKDRRQSPALLATTSAAITLFLAQALLGARLVGDPPVYLLAVHEATATAVYSALVVLSVGVFLERRAAPAPLVATRFRRIILDLFLLTKPVVVALLLVTTYAGMVIAGKELPAAGLVFWTLLGGFMAAGGSGAINQYIDRFDDRKMQRTQKRPIPSGRLTPGEGLAFGVALTLASFFLMLAFVNLLAALLTLAGIIYYVLLYSIFLKKTTVQNIVIGGGAGAIPPLVGWAAATGELNVPALFLFAVVFMWTPPHFWALALVRRKDYARAGVPMLPVVRGEKETRWQILIYTSQLVGLTLLLPIFGLGGSVYLVSAIVLGGWILACAWRVWKWGGNKLAWKMYRYSSMYLALLFLVLMVDALL